MSVAKETWEFNLELLFGELGSLGGAPLLAFLMSKVTANETFISTSAVIGGLIGGAVFWLATHIFDEKKDGVYSSHHLKKDITSFTPVAFLLALAIYQPILFFNSRYLLSNGDSVVYSVIGAQLVAFSCFLIAINLYRRWYNTHKKKRLFS